MKLRHQWLLIPTIIILCILLSGCALRAQAREVDQLLVMQTMGVDVGGGGVLLSLSSAAGGDAEADRKPVRLEGRGPSITEALERIRAGANEEDLFCAHIGHLLIGEAAARQGIAPYLDYVCRSGDLRLSVPVYILRGSTARDAVLGVGDESFGICDALDSVDADLRPRGDGYTATAADILRDLARSGSALVCAVSLRPSAEKDQSAEAGEAPDTVLPDGYAVLKDGKLCGYLDREQALGAGFLTGHTGLSELAVTDQAGLPVTLMLTGGSCSLEPRFDEEGQLSALDVSIEAEAVLAESARGATELSYLQMMLERALSERVREVLQLSKQWEADFLGLGGQLELLAPGRMQAQSPDFAARWPSLPLTVSVSARVTGTGDVEAVP